MKIILYTTLQGWQALFDQKDFLIRTFSGFSPGVGKLRHAGQIWPGMILFSFNIPYFTTEVSVFKNYLECLSLVKNRCYYVWFKKRFEKLTQFIKKRLKDISFKNIWVVLNEKEKAFLMIFVELRQFFKCFFFLKHT